MQSLVANIAILETEVLSKYADTAGVFNAKKFEVGKKLVKPVLDLSVKKGQCYSINSMADSEKTRLI